MMKSRLVTGGALAAVLVLSGACGGDSPTNVSVAGQPETSPCQLPRDRGANDTVASNDEPKDGDELITTEYPTYPEASTRDLVNEFDFVVVMRVVGRDEPRAAPQRQFAGALESGASGGSVEDAATGGGRPDVVRPARFEVQRVIRGTFEDCAEFDVPGGVAGEHALVNPLFPDRLETGKRVLAFGLGTSGDEGDPLRVQHMVVTAEDGTVTLPFGGGEIVDVDTWEP